MRWGQEREPETVLRGPTRRGKCYALAWQPVQEAKDDEYERSRGKDLQEGEFSECLRHGIDVDVTMIIVCLEVVGTEEGHEPGVMAVIKLTGCVTVRVIRTRSARQMRVDPGHSEECQGNAQRPDEDDPSHNSGDDGTVSRPGTTGGSHPVRLPCSDCHVVLPRANWRAAGTARRRCSSHQGPRQNVRASLFPAWPFHNRAMPGILIIEDDAKTAKAIARGLETEGHRTEVALTGDEGRALSASRAFDCIILDWMLPGTDGIEILRELRANGRKVPVLLLTARDAVADRVRGLDSGADDYLIKPFAFTELLARIRVLLRRSGEREDQIRIADLHLDLTNRQVRRAGRRIALSPRELDLLAYLARHQGQTVSRRMLAKDVWRELQRATPLDNVIDVHIAHLRRKIDEGHAVKLLHTVRGVGFVLKESVPRA